MDFVDALNDHVEHVMKYKDYVNNEEQTKQSLIMPFFKMLGYDVLNPTEFIPEYTADVGIKKGEKVDYAIAIDEKPIILVECKSVDDDLEKHGSQLFRYFGTTEAKFGILTNGILYKFYTDLDQPNKMDNLPFLVIDLENLQDRDVAELQKFSRASINEISEIIDSAETLKYTKQVKDWFVKEISSPSPDFVKYVLNTGIYHGQKNQGVIERFTPIVKKAIGQYISDSMNSRIKAALAKDTKEESEEEQSEQLKQEKDNKIETTMEELEAFAIVKSILRPVVDSNRISYKDTASYFGILFDDNSWKWICRIFLRSSKSYIVVAGENKKEERYNISGIDDIYNYADEIIDSCKRYL
ncbi:MAG: type I restriction enzyme HsdR N-terminal domain-containing protein [Mobilibacterium timonense]|uniref:type I restriction endonuclease n=1 Tax=Mobilibacterium timonense TaxID=1871012 RepID=UPI002353EE39|nr:type I restriction endonuclease [Mobilibacterium timonense]MBM6990182.1 type I restriction enzyme HsdR N-terminal domain-containing protein [Mobilibacterium timonense]